MSQTEHSDIEDLIFKSLSGGLTPAEEEVLAVWCAQSESNQELFDLLSQSWRTRYSDPRYLNANALKNKIIAEGFEKELKHRDTGRYLWPWLRGAAVLVLCSWLGYMMYRTEEVVEPTVVANPEVVKYNPPGVKSMIILSDSSIVWLNADSRLVYQKGFSDSMRIVELNGEAFFEVSRDVNRPFIVKSGNVSTQALGTSFNIRHYPEEAKTNVALLTGKVSVTTDDQEKAAQTFFLDPYEQLDIYRDLSRITKAKMNSNIVSAWKDNILSFRNGSFTDVIKSLERWYGVTIETSAYTNTRDWNYVAEFRNQSLERVLSRIGYTQGFGFTIHDKTVRIFDQEKTEINQQKK